MPIASSLRTLDTHFSRSRVSPALVSSPIGFAASSRVIPDLLSPRGRRRGARSPPAHLAALSTCCSSPHTPLSRTSLSRRGRRGGGAREELDFHQLSSPWRSCRFVVVTFSLVGSGAPLKARLEISASLLDLLKGQARTPTREDKRR